jgi:hypothetical protein
MKQRSLLVTLVGAEVNRFCRSAHAASMIPLGLLAVPCALWPFIGDPFLPAFLAVWIGTEPLFGNVLFGTPRELDAIGLLPVEWEVFVRAKNLAAVIIASGLAVCLIAATLFVLPERPAAGTIASSSLAFLTSTVLLLHAGNRRSIHSPRRRVRWDLDGIAAAAMHLIAGTGCLLILQLLLGIPGGILLNMGICGWALVSWHRRAVPLTAAQIDANLHLLCSNAQMPSPVPALSSDSPADEPSLTD